jgi:Putative addiction module component
MTSSTSVNTTNNSPSGMMTLAEIESAALKLNDSEKAELVVLLGGAFPSVDMGEADPDEERWQAEIQRRVDDIRQGRVVGRDGEVVMREALARYS